MEKPVNRLFSNVVKKRLLCFSIALLLCILAYVYQSISGTGMGSSQAANVPAATINGVVFNDSNDNGQRDAHEAGISNVTVHLYHTDGKLAETALTDANGVYSFSAASNTDYQIKLDNAADYTTGPLKGYRLTAVHSDNCTDQANSNTVLPDSGKSVGPGNYPQVVVKSHASDSRKHSFDVGFTTGKPAGDSNRTLSSRWHYCYPFGDETPTPGTHPVQTPTPEGVTPTPEGVTPTPGGVTPTPEGVTPTPEGVTPTPGSKPEQTPTPTPKKPAPTPTPKKPVSTPPTTYPKLPGTGSDPVGHLLP